MDGPGLEERIITYFLAPDDHSPPGALLDHWAIGESRYLVAGGVDDQPASRWTAANYAGFVYQILEEARRQTDTPLVDRLSDGQWKAWRGDKDKGVEGLETLQKRIRSEIAAHASG